MPELFKKITNKEFDPKRLLHKYEKEATIYLFNNREDDCIKVILKPSLFLMKR